MLLETIVIAGCAALWGGVESFRVWKKVQGTAQLPAPTVMPKSEVAQLVVEALREKEDWVQYGTTYCHSNLGIQIKFDSEYMTYEFRIKVFVKTDSSLERIDLSNDDLKIIEAELKAYKSREADRKQREIARVLAKRVLGTPPTSGSAVLGGRGVSSDVSGSEVDQDRGSDSVPAGMLTYDKRSGQVVQIGGTDAGVLMDAALRKRYELYDMKYDPFNHLYITRSNAGGVYRTYKGVPIKYIPPSGED